MIKKFDEFKVIEESVIDNIKNFLSKKKEVKSEYQSDNEILSAKSGPETGEEGDEEHGNPGRYTGPILGRKMNGKAPISKPTFPCVYSIMTQELADRKRANGFKHIGIIPDGYSFYCETEKELDNYKAIYKSGNKYKGETITGTGIGRTEH